MKVKLGRVTIKFPKTILEENYQPINEYEMAIRNWIVEKLNNNEIEIIPDTNFDLEKLIEGKRKKTYENIRKIASFIEKQYYVKQKPISFLEVAYKTGLSLPTIKRYLKGILKDKEIVTISKDELIEKIANNLFKKEEPKEDYVTPSNMTYENNWQ